MSTTTQVQGHVTKVILAAVMVMVVVMSPSYAAVYTVGNAAGWTTIGNVDYKDWAATKSFRIGDVILFQYNPQFHNVMQVNHAGYKSCNASSPIATHTTGNDTITITKHGHYFFLCGVPGHCQTGQKVDIHVLKTVSTTIAPSPSVASSPANAAATMAPGPSNSSPGPWTMSTGLACLTAAVIAAVLVGFPMF